MIQRISKRFLSLLLTAVMVLALVPAVTLPAFAETSGTVTGLSDANIGLSFSGTADDAWNATGTTINGSVVSVGGTCSDASYNSTLTIKNNKTAKATLSFNYSIKQNSGTIEVNNSSVTASGSFSKELDAGASITVKITSGSTTATEITMTNVALVSDVTATTTFVPAENGTYTVDSKAVTEEYSSTQSSMTAYQVVATPAEGYQFLGWYNLTTGKCVATTAAASLNIESDCTITAKFVNKSVALFETGGQRFADLNEAVTYAQANKQSKITLATDGSISGTYTIPKGITLLIPFDAAGTLYTDSPAAIRTTPASEPFRTLTMSEGTSITVNGAISLGGRYFAAAGSQQGRPVGDYGYIKMADNSSITVKNGGNLYAWGFISGSGSILAESGATVYEFYQIADFRGGSASSGMGNKVFPFSQYFVQNIEVPLTLNAGANEKVFSGVYAMSSTYTTSINFIGDNGMFKVVSGSFTKDYDEKTDRLILTVNGEAELNTLSLKLAGMSVNSASYVLPITNNISINIQSGKVTINQDTALLAGVEVSIAEGADLTVSSGKNVYIYDGDEWNSDNFVWGACKFKSVAYAPGKTYNRTNADLKDAKVDVNGSLTAIGAIYTTKGGADICSSNGTGKYVQQGKPGTETVTYQYNANGNSAVTFPITPAKLHNADGSYTETAKVATGTTIPYVNGVWGGTAKATVTFNANDGIGEMDPMEVQAGTKISLTQNAFTRADYTFTGWNTKADGTGDTYADKAEITATGDITLYAQWTQNPVITFNANGGDGTMASRAVKPNEVTALNENTFTRTDYDFAGWNTAEDGSGTPYNDKAEITTDENITLYAQWTLHKYHVRWLNWDNSVLQEGDYTCEDFAEWDWANDDPSRPEDENYTYVFLNRWTPYDATNEIDGGGFYPHANVDFTAVFNKFEKLTATFDANGGTGTMEPAKIVNGASGKYYTLPECGFTAPDGYVFDGWLITGTVKMSAFGEEFELNEEAWEKNKLLAMSNLTLKASWKMLENDWYVENGNYYYRLNGKPVTGMVRVPYPAADLLPGYGPDAEDAAVNVPGKAGNPDNYDYPDRESALFVFDENGVFQKDQCGVYNDDGVTRWISNGMLVWHAGLVKDGDDYRYFKRNGMVASVETYVAKTNDLLTAAKYTFDAEGKLMKLEGLHEDLNGNLCYYVDYVKSYAGLVEVDGSYYYIASDLKAVKDCTYYVTKTNDLKPAGYYTFDADGKMVIKSGLVEENGDLYYYVDGSKMAAGLIEWEGNYYYIASNLKAVKNAKHYVFADRANGLKSAGWYWFNADGTMFLDGIREENGTKYYYKDGVKNYAGLIEISGEYYYVKSDCSVVCGRSYYVTKSNGLMPSATYTFDADGKMVIKNGIYREKLGDGNEYLFYYVNNVRQVGTGLVQLDDGSYIYVRSGANLAVGSYYVSKTNDLLPKGTYTFGEDGKMVVEP